MDAPEVSIERSPADVPPEPELPAEGGEPMSEIKCFGRNDLRRYTDNISMIRHKGSGKMRVKAKNTNLIYTSNIDVLQVDQIIPLVQPLFLFNAPYHPGQHHNKRLRVHLSPTI